MQETWKMPAASNRPISNASDTRAGHLKCASCNQQNPPHILLHVTKKPQLQAYRPTPAHSIEVSFNNTTHNSKHQTNFNHITGRPHRKRAKKIRWFESLSDPDNPGR